MSHDLLFSKDGGARVSKEDKGFNIEEGSTQASCAERWSEIVSKIVRER